MAEPSTKRQKTTSKSQTTAAAGPRITDPRFANIQSDPRYRLPGKKNKVKLDKRFARVLQDDDFVKRAKVDRYGRLLDSGAEKTRLKRKYEFDEDEQEGSDVPDDDDEVQKEMSRVGTKLRDPLREGRDTDSESSDESDTSEEESGGDVEERHRELAVEQQDAPTGEVTSRIAIVNLDWDNVRATDLMAVFSSFLPSTGGSILKVSVYPSDFGKERLEREEMEGPPHEIFASAVLEDSNDEDMSDEEEADEDIKASILKNENGDEDFNPTALRKYQLERLRYFYAILTFSSPPVAKHIYDAVDGTEYLRTANFFDLRFVPEDTDFSSDIPREDCERIPDDYKPNEFVTDALQHSKVKLTWDAEDTGRKEAVARAFTSGKAKGRKGMQEMEHENDLRAYLASDGSDEDDEDEDKTPIVNATNDASVPPLSKKEAERQRMRTLLGLPLDSVKPSKPKDKAPVGDMQITFTSGLNPSKDDKTRSVFENSPEPDETTREKYVRKEKERKQKRKDKMKPGSAPDAGPHEAIPIDAADQTAQVPNDETQDLGFADPFFASTDPSTLAENASKKPRKEERLRRRKEHEIQEEADKKQRAELELLMADDPDGDTDEADREAKQKRKMKHFDMREIERAEKDARKKSKKPKSKTKSKDVPGRTGEEGVAQDDFKVNTSDPRFSRLFSSHEFAIDPTNPRFKGTKGMQALLEEGRKRKGNNEGDGIGDVVVREENERSRKDRKSPRATAQNGKAVQADVQSLVEKIKRRQR